MAPVRTRRSTALRWLGWPLRAFHEKLAFPARNRDLARRLGPWLEGAPRVLDCGAGDGKLAVAIAQRVGGEFVGCDVHVPSVTSIPVVAYDGAHLPWADRQFDCVLLSDVLHHARDPRQVLQEARRVSRRHVIVKDHDWRGRLDYAALAFFDWIANAPFGIHVPMNFLQEQQWHDLFRAVGLTILQTQKFRLHRLDPCRQILFKLAVD